jgi:hypothetical protein
LRHPYSRHVFSIFLITARQSSGSDNEHEASLLLNLTSVSPLPMVVWLRGVSPGVTASANAVRIV